MKVRVHKKIKYYEVRQNSSVIVIIPAVGHLFSLKQVDVGWTFPCLDIQWVPAYDASAKSQHVKPYVELLEKLVKKSSEYIIMTDYDLEGEVIGCVAFLQSLKKIYPKSWKGKAESIRRMQFSTLTRSSILDSFANIRPTFDKGQFDAGLTRHYIDWMFGINISRALTLSIKDNLGAFKSLSMGRVQGPTLSFVVKNDQAISLHVPLPYWVISLSIAVNDDIWQLSYKKAKIEKENDAKKILERLQDVEQVEVQKVTEKEEVVSPPVPLDLGSLQSLSFRYFRYSPRQTLQIAEDLYLGALISYPRTSSQKLPETLDHKTILAALGKQRKYKKTSEAILGLKNPVPNEGKKEDPAHPAIHPTGETPKKLGKRHANVYDLIVRHYFAVFGEDAIFVRTRVTFLAGTQDSFSLSGRRVSRSGWLVYYSPYGKQDDQLLPTFNNGDTHSINSLELIEKYTSPPRRLNPNSLLKQMEKENIGTKATRADTIDTLYRRGYISGDSIQITVLGRSLHSILKTYSPLIVDLNMTTTLEKQMESIRSGEETVSEVLHDASQVLIEILRKLEFNSLYLGLDLYEKFQQTTRILSILSSCPKCESGDLSVIVSKASSKRFIGCSNYYNEQKDEKCNFTSPVPQKGTIVKTTSKCKYDDFPQVIVKTKNPRPWIICLNVDCESSTLNKKGSDKKEEVNKTPIKKVKKRVKKRKST